MERDMNNSEWLPRYDEIIFRSWEQNSVGNLLKWLELKSVFEGFLTQENSWNFLDDGLSFILHQRQKSTKSKDRLKYCSIATTAGTHL